MADTHLAQMFFDRARSEGQSPGYRVRQGNAYVDVPFGEAADRVEAIAAGVLKGGHAPAIGTCVTIMANTRLEWILADWALLSLGYRTVPIYVSLLPPEIGYIHADTKAELLVVENKEMLDKVRAAQRGFTFFEIEYPADAIKLKRFIVLDPTGIAPGDDWESLADVEARGRAALAETKGERDKRMQAIQRSDVATYTYTSGTTGPPKGVIQTHGNMLSMLENVEEVGMFSDKARVGGAFLFLPLAHSFGRLVEFGGAFFRCKIVLSSIATVAEDLGLARPGFLPAAPRVYERVYGKIMTTVASSPALRQKIFHWALGVGKATIPYRQKNKSLPLALGIKYGLADRLVFSKLKAKLGMDRMHVLLSGSAPLPKEVGEFFIALGLNVCEAYGLTETCPGLTTNRPNNWKIGTVGPAIKGVSLRLAEDGEILAKGPNVVGGYLNRPDATAEAWDSEGWFHTGDIGEFDEDMHLRITDRKKDLIKTSGGKYVAPQKIEALLKTKPILSEAVVIGDGRKYCVVLVTVDKEKLAAWSQRTGNPADINSGAVQKEVQGYLDEVNQSLASFESIKYFKIAPEEFTVDNGMLTASFKVKRKEVSKRYKALIDSMFSAGKE
ncbi:AMP-dependent synthetase/ligase [Nannocystis bainbridge]|uniref:Long-chain fatty acid--CoA ligase n=1 Tax=Nannocystis bainbridge TaxID=2995303 RepID=A0ABT5DVQ4_9BACT|nr:long-chain fatty acid--CoA ligase [Nannocystis bainbridge]MDC0717701.1 long-chain fatty acid--CoA ligase [Nannocystis bainbridge]